ncbi:hypothetical protein MD484_g4008, partial [Candolleomyces efflorescens]
MSSGYRIYRHNGWYHVYFNHCNSHPDGLGQWAIAEIPKDPQLYQVWLSNVRLKLDRNLEKLRELYKEPRDTYGDRSFRFYITRTQPTKSTRIQWVWELDCDREILHVDCRPFFRLANVPRGELFLSSISVDHFGHRACSKNLPPEYRYKWKVGMTPPCASSVEKYNQLVPKVNVMSARKLLGLPDRTGNCEQVRSALYQVLVGTAMRTWAVAHDIPLLEQVSTPADIPDRLIELGRAMLYIALHPMIFCKYEYHLRQPVTCSQDRFQWVHPEVCVQFQTHLEDGDTLKACIASLVAKIGDSPKPEVKRRTFAIFFSFTHLSIAQINVHRDGSVDTRHTPALPFLPSFFATTSSTPGISALVALSMALDNSHILPSQSNSTVIAGPPLPVEIWHRIASYVSSCSDLKTLAVLSPQSRSAAQSVLRYPHIAGHRLLRPLSEAVDPCWVSPRWCRALQEDYHPQDGVQELYSRAFVASQDDQSGLSIQVAPGDPPLRPLSRSWSERSSSVAWLVKEGQFDLIPVDGIHTLGWSVKYGISRM